MLLALLRERDGVAVRVLLGASVDPRALRDEVGRRSRESAAPALLPAAGDTGVAGGDALGAHALLGVLAAGGPAAALLRAHGVDEDAVRALLR